MLPCYVYLPTYEGKTKTKIHIKATVVICSGTELIHNLEEPPDNNQQFTVSCMFSYLFHVFEFKTITQQNSSCKQ